MDKIKFQIFNYVEDEEQVAKFEQIIEMLVNAGYYRARIQGLSNFDKIVGGMTWCIESCYFGVDIDLLFQENLTIGQKIALTEKIVIMLPKMNCPNIIEPHQIQGLDYIHIFPVMQWLIQESMKTRKEMAKYVQLFAITQFNKKFTLKENFILNDKLYGEYLTSNIKLIKETYQPYRQFKQKDTKLVDEFAIISNVLLEYGETLQISQSIINKFHESKINHFIQDKEITKAIIERKMQEKIKVEELKKNLSKFDDKNKSCVSSNIVGKIVDIQAQEVAKVVEQYSTSLASGSEVKLSPFTCILSILEKEKFILKNKSRNMSKIRGEFNYRLIEMVELLKYTQKTKQTINKAHNRTNNIEFSGNNGILQKLKELIIVLNGLKGHEKMFRDQCKLDLNKFNNIIKALKDQKFNEEIDNVAEYENQRKKIHLLRLQLAKKNRAIVTYMRQLDDIPERFELTQYQRRFMELYNQVSIKHKETKQYYTLYNTLDDKKLYLSKELSLLNSIQDNYNEAMTSSNTREQFIKQFEYIIDGVQRNKIKIQKRCTDEKNRRDVLSLALVNFIDQHRKYVSAVRQLTIECRKNEMLLIQLRGL
ncbi:PREDICTED: coiled-coil domain-containing protein 93 [Ceratosolen solmsi marchali]|uniref:Coiled-coil domain-containing protein 93 n=1 Tax=Ceratosolen solmsi marchali TaxID=326594 RepID=A0AAJ6YQJ7_9HYME|nr:PREDICTED: coiled-coil domain-containing protein 93 [Ceratosolen solmsi marchali]